MTTERLRGFEVGTSQFRRLLNRQVASLLALEDTTESAWVGRATHPRWPTSRRWSCSPITALATAPNPRRHNIDDACRAALVAKSASDAVNAKSAAGEIVELPSPAPDLWKKRIVKGGADERSTRLLEKAARSRRPCDGRSA